MKKLLLTLVACFVAIAANAWTVKFTNPDGWSTPYIWAWIDGGSNFTGGNWPGQPMTKDSDGTWSFTYSGPIAGVPQKVIFSNNGSPQTGNLNFVDGAIYDKSGPVGAVKYKYTVYFDNTNNWPYVNIYGWGSMGYTAGWPGTTLQKGSNGLYEFSFETTDPNPPVIGDDDGFLFYGGSDNYKTPDIKSFTNGATYYPNGTTEPNAINYASWYVNLSGAFNGNIFDNTYTQPDKDGLATFESVTIGNDAFELKTWDNVNDAYYNSCAAGNLIPGQWMEISNAGYEGQFLRIEGALKNENFKVEFDCTNNNIRVTSLGGGVVEIPNEFYIMGNVNGNDWSPNKNVPMQGSEGTFTATNVIVDDSGEGYGYVGFATNKTDLGGDEDGWDNLGTRYGAATENEIPTLGEPTAMVPNGSNYSFKLLAGSYDISVTFDEKGQPSVTFTQSAPSIPEKLQIALGSSTTFGTITFNPDTDLVFESTESGVFVVKDVPLVRYGAFVFYGNGDANNVYTPSAMLNLRFGTYTEWPNAGVSNPNNKFAEGGDNTWYVGTLPTGITNPQYDITVDFNSMTISLVAHAPAVVEPEPFYFMGYNEDGDQVPIKEKMTPSSTDPNVYEFTYNVPNYKDGFKFYFSSTGKVAQTDNFVPAIANELIKFGEDKTYKATWSNTGTGQAIDRVAGETVFRFNVETLECEVEYAGNFVNFEFTGVENAYYYVNMANLTGDDMVVYLYGNSVQYGIDKSSLTGLMAAPMDGYTLEITCPEASGQNYMIQQGGIGDEQQILLYPGAQGYTFTFTVSKYVEPVYSFKGQVRNFDFEVDGNTLTYFGVLGPQTFVIEKKVGEEVQTTYYGPGITGFGNYTGNTTSEGPWNLSADVVNVNGSPIMLTFNLDDLVLTVSTGLTASAGTADTQQSGTIENGAASGTINLVSNQDYAWVFFNIPEEATAVYYKVTNVNPLTNVRRNAAPEGYQEADTWEWDSPEKGSYYAQLLSGTSGTLDVIYEIDGAQSKPITYTYTVTQSVPTGVDGIDADEEGAEYYTIDGVKVLNPERGIFIRVQNGKVTKVVK